MFNLYVYIMKWATYTQKLDYMSFLQKMFIKLKMNSSLILDKSISQLNEEIGRNRQLLQDAIRGKVMTSHLF